MDSPGQTGHITVLLISCARASRIGSSSSDAQANMNVMIAARKTANAERGMSRVGCECLHLPNQRTTKGVVIHRIGCGEEEKAESIA